MRKRNVLIFISAVFFLYLFFVNSATLNKTSSDTKNLLSDLYRSFHEKILYPVISRSESDTITATAICVDGVELVVAENIEQAKRLVNELALYISSFHEGTMVSAIPNGKLTYRTAPYPVNRITDYEKAFSLLKGFPQNNGYYTVKKDDTQASIAQKFGISEKTLLLLNPSSTFSEDERILTVIPPPALSLKITMQEIKNESVPIEYKYEYDPTLRSSDRVIYSYGQAGMYNTTQTVVYEDFVEINRKLEKKTEITESKPQIIKVGTIPPISSGRFLYPVNGGEITSFFGLRERNDHKGIDIALDIGEPIHASDGGIVITSGVVEGYGNTVIIDHKNGFVTLYAHCDKLLVSESSTVVQGEKIATVGNTGISTGPHLHFEIQKDGVSEDPLKYIN